MPRSQYAISRGQTFNDGKDLDANNLGRKKRLALPILLYMLFVVLPVHFNAGPLALTGLRALLLVMIVPLTVNLLLGKYGKLLWTDILFFVHLLWAGLALGLNNPDEAVEFFGSVLIEFMGGYILARAYIRSAADFVALCRLFFFLVICTLPFAVLEAQTGRATIPALIRSIPSLGSVQDFHNDLAGMRFGLNRTQVVFVHPIHYGLYCSVAFALAFVSFKGIYSDLKRIMITLLIMMCVFFSLSSGALLAVVLQIVLILWAWFFNPVKFRWMLLMAFMIVTYIVVDLLSNRTPLRVFLTYATFSAHNGYWRYLIFEWGMVNVRANPIFGLGLNDWVRPHFMNSGSMDNFWLLNAVRYGIPGFAALFLGYVLAIWKIGRVPFKAKSQIWYIRRGWMFAFLGLSFTLATVHVWGTIFSFTFFLFGAGVWMINYGSTSASENHLQGSSKQASRRVKAGLVVTEPEIQTSAAIEQVLDPRSVSFTRFPSKVLKD